MTDPDGHFALSLGESGWGRAGATAPPRA